MSTNTWVKLDNGTWGIKGKGLVAGMRVIATRRNGETCEVKVDGVERTTADGYTLAYCTKLPKAGVASKASSQAADVAAQLAALRAENAMLKAKLAPPVAAIDPQLVAALEAARAENAKLKAIVAEPATVAYSAPVVAVPTTVINAKPPSKRRTKADVANAKAPVASFNAPRVVHVTPNEPSPDRDGSWTVMAF